MRSRLSTPGQRAAALLALAGLVLVDPAGLRAASGGPLPGTPRPSTSVTDTIAQRVAACVTCHGRQDRVAPDAYYPRIAGKPAGYLYNQLVNFREGRREYAPMTHLLDPLSDDYLREIALYFAGLDLPYPPPPQPAAAPARTLEQGRRLALQGDASRELPACVQCHGDTLMGVVPAIPGLRGLSRDYINAQFGAWRNGQRKAASPDCMARIAARLTPDDIAAVSSWLAAQPVPPGAKPAAGPLAELPLPCGAVAP